MRPGGIILTLVMIAAIPSSATYTARYTTLNFESSDTPPSCEHGASACMWYDGKWAYYRNGTNYSGIIGGAGEPIVVSLITRQAGTYYILGDYEWSPTSATLNEATTVSHGNAAESHYAHAGALVSAVGTSDGTCSLVVTGATIDDTDRSINSSDSETLIADVTAASTTTAYKSTKLWLGAVTYDLVLTSGTSCALTFNYGLSIPEDGAEVDFRVNEVSCSGVAGASDSDFEIELLHDKGAGWTYAASGFVPGPATTVALTADTPAYNDLTNNGQFRHRISYTEITTARAATPGYLVIKGSQGEGLIIRVTTGIFQSVRFMTCRVFTELGIQD